MKYEYVKVIQFGQYGQWSDESEYTTKANGNFATTADRLAFKADLEEYKLAHKGNGQTRVISRRNPKG